MSIGQMRAHTRFVQHTTEATMNALMRAYQIAAENLQSNGLAPHFARVDADFVNQPENLGAVLQWSGQVAAVNLTTDVWTGANALRTLLLAHFADAEYAHVLADTTDAALLTLLAAPPAVDDATASVLIAAEKAAVNAHVVNGTYHASVPPSLLAVTVTGTPADAATNKATYNEMLAVYKRHVFSAIERLDFEAV